MFCRCRSSATIEKIAVINRQCLLFKHNCSHLISASWPALFNLWLPQFLCSNHNDKNNYWWHFKLYFLHFSHTSTISSPMIWESPFLCWINNCEPLQALYYKSNFPLNFAIFILQLDWLFNNKTAKLFPKFPRALGTKAAKVNSEINCKILTKHLIFLSCIKTSSGLLNSKKCSAFYTTVYVQKTMFYPIAH